MLKEKAAFLQKHDQALFGKDFRDRLIESLKAKQQFIEVTAKVSKSTYRKRPLRESPPFYQGRPNGEGKNSGRTTTVNTFCSKRKEPFHSKSQISRLVMINMEE